MRCSVDQITMETGRGRPESFIWRAHFWDELDLPMMGMGASLFAHELVQQPQYAAPITTLRSHYVDLARQVFLDWDEFLADGQGFALERVNVTHYSVGDQPGYGISVEALRAGDRFAGTLLLTHYSLRGAVTVNHKLIIEDRAVADWIDTRCQAILTEAEAVSMAIMAGRDMTPKRETKVSQFLAPERQLRKARTP